VIEPFEDLPFKDEALSVPLIRVYYLFEGEQALLVAPFPDQVDRTRLTFTKETFDDIAPSRGVSDGYSPGEYQLFLLHIVFLQHFVILNAFSLYMSRSFRASPTVQDDTIFMERCDSCAQQD